MAKMTFAAGYREIGLILAVAFKAAGFQDKYDELMSELNRRTRSANYFRSICSTTIDFLLNEPAWEDKAVLYSLAQEMAGILSDLDEGQLEPKQIGDLFLNRRKKEAYRQICLRGHRSFPADEYFQTLVGYAKSEDDFCKLCWRGIEALRKSDALSAKVLTSTVCGIERARTEKRIEDLLIAIR